MRITVSISIQADEDSPAVTEDVFTCERTSPLSADTVGLHLEEAKALLSGVQETMVDQQAQAALAQAAACPACGAARRHKDARQIVVRTLYGVVRLDSPRWWQCGCTPASTATFSPLTELLLQRTTPELAYLEARFAALTSYGMSAKLLAEILPLGRPLHATAIRFQAQAVAQRLEDELGEEQAGFIDTCPAQWEELPRPDLPLVVGLDGGYVHSSQQRSRKDGWFEVIVGKTMSADGASSCFGYVQTYDTKPKRRLYEALKAQGMQDNQQLTFLTDGGEDIRELPLYLNPQSEHLLDWFHLTMRITVMANMAKSLRPPPPDPDPDLEPPAESAARLITGVREDLGRLKWFCWHGNVFRALATIEGLIGDLEILQPDDEHAPGKLLAAVNEFDSYIRANADRIPNYGERRRAGEAISTAFTESAVNQVLSKRMVKKQQMRWSPRGAHLLLQVRTRVLNGTLADDYRRWYPGFTHHPPRLEEPTAA